jgi:hypothetical protein
MLTFNSTIDYTRYLKKLLTGLTVPQQYVCLSLEDFSDPLSVFLSGEGLGQSLDVTSHHLFVGYKPLIIAIVFSAGIDTLPGLEQVRLDFVHRESKRNSWKVSSDSKNCLATVTARRIFSKSLNHQQIVFYEGDYGSHRFINRFHQLINNLREKLRKDTPNNVSLPGNLYDQVRIAYAVPRIIALISLCQGNKMNMFPTDLHGPAGDAFYISSLRHGGKANSQVEHAGKLVLSFMPVEEYKTVYTLGKNHMQDMQAEDKFPASGRSAFLNLPIPASVLYYKELELIDSVDAGIHRIHFYKVLHAEKVRDGQTLAHIHQYYAQWRIDRNLPVNMRLR